MENKKELVYLAVPYSHPRPEIREERFRAVNRVAAKLMGQGLHIFSPISHSHPISIEGNLPTNWEYWEAYDRAFLNASNKLIVLMLDGWDKSVGVAGEIAIAKELGIEIEYIEENVKGHAPASPSDLSPQPETSPNPPNSEDRREAGCGVPTCCASSFDFLRSLNSPNAIIRAFKPLPCECIQM
jgi:hypothetical protein